MKMIENNEPHICILIHITHTIKMKLKWQNAMAVIDILRDKNYISRDDKRPRSLSLSRSFTHRRSLLVVKRKFYYKTIFRAYSFL